MVEEVGELEEEEDFYKNKIFDKVLAIFNIFIRLNVLVYKGTK